MNREMRRLQEREDRRLKQKRKQQQRKRRPQRGGEQLSLMTRLRRFMREVRAELKRVSWPSMEQLFAFTVVTVITSMSLTIYIFGLDFLFKDGILFFLGGS